MGRTTGWRGAIGAIEIVYEVEEGRLGPPIGVVDIKAQLLYILEYESTKSFMKDLNCFVCIC